MLRATGHAYHARMARRAQHLRCSLCERSERGDNKLDKAMRASSIVTAARFYAAHATQGAIIEWAAASAGKGKRRKEPRVQPGKLRLKYAPAKIKTPRGPRCASAVQVRCPDQGLSHAACVSTWLGEQVRAA